MCRPLGSKLWPSRAFCAVASTNTSEVYNRGFVIAYCKLPSHYFESLCIQESLAPGVSPSFSSLFLLLLPQGWYARWVLWMVMREKAKEGHWEDKGSWRASLRDGSECGMWHTPKQPTWVIVRGTSACLLGTPEHSWGSRCAAGSSEMDGSHTGAAACLRKGSRGVVGSTRPVHWLCLGGVSSRQSMTWGQGKAACCCCC